MKKTLKIILKILLVFTILALVFFVWGSSSTLDKAKYTQLITNNYENKLATDSVFSIVTYNIGYLSGMTNNRPVPKPEALFDKNLQKVISETKIVNPDIMAFQEIDYNSARSYYVNQQNEIAKLGYNYIAEAVNWDKTYVPYPYWPISMHFGKIVSGQSILSKYPLKDYKRIELERVADAPFYRDAFYLDRLAQTVKVTLNGQEVVLINVHLEAFDKTTRKHQFKAILKLFNEYKTKYPTILLGDFNSTARDTNAVVKKIFAMKDVGNAAFNTKKPVKTFDSKNPTERIDYIFYTKNSIDYISGKVLTQFGEASDHLPVFMEFRLK
ncbi:MAG: endonuclease/exonuclease/phosphatase family protein [Polaribacter sp.]